MKEFVNSNYICENAPRKPGVYYIHNQRRGKRGYSTSHFYFVRVRGENGGYTTVGRCDRRADAERLFRDYMPDWEGEVPYSEIGNRIKRFTTRK